MNTIKILVADDHQIIIDGLRSIFEFEDGFEIVAEANNGREALKILELIPVDLVLLDLDMPVLNGVETAKAIRKDFPPVKIIILTMHFEHGLVKRLMEAGIDGYVVKNSDKSELLLALRKVMEGKKYFSPDITYSLLDQNGNRPGFKHLQPDVQLTEREIEIMKLIAAGYSNKEVGERLFISHRTVDTHRTNIMKKIGVNNIAGLIRYAIQKGYAG